MTPKRYFQLDYAKAIGIILVIIGHSFFYLKPIGQIHTGLNLFLYSFHIPLFFILSGLGIGLKFNGNCSSDDIKSYSKQLFKKLIVPYAIWSAIYFLVGLAGLYFNNLDNYISSFIKEQVLMFVTLKAVSPLWFLIDLFIGLIAFLAIINTKVFKSKPFICHIIFACFTIGISIGCDSLIKPFLKSMDSVCLFSIAVSRLFPTLFFLDVGYLLSKIWEKYINLKFFKRLFIFLFFVLLIYVFRNLFTYKAYLYIYYFEYIQTFFITGVLGSLAVITFCCLGAKEIGFLSWLGKETLTVMILHPEPIPTFLTASFCLALLGIEDNVLLISFMNLAICLLLIKLWKRIKQKYAK